MATGGTTELMDEFRVRSVREEPEPDAELSALGGVLDEELWMEIHGCADSSEDDEEDAQFDDERQDREELIPRLFRVGLGGGQDAVQLPGPVPRARSFRGDERE